MQWLLWHGALHWRGLWCLTTTSWDWCGTSPSSRARRTAPRPSCTPTPVSTANNSNNFTILHSFKQAGSISSYGCIHLALIQKETYPRIILPLADEVKGEDLDEGPLGDVPPSRLEPLPLAGERGLVAHHRRVEHLHRRTVFIFKFHQLFLNWQSACLVIGGLLHVVGLQDVLPLQRLAQDRPLLLQVRIVSGLTTDWNFKLKVHNCSANNSTWCKEESCA